MLEETPWLRQAQAESQARRNVGILFDDNRLNDETGAAAAEAGRACSLADGAWPWFPGGPAERLHHAVHHHRLRPAAAPGRGARHGRPAVKSLARLDAWIDEIYREILKHGKKDENHLSHDDRPVPVRPQLLPEGPGRSTPQHKEAVDYFLGQAKQVLAASWTAASRRATWPWR